MVYCTAKDHVTSHLRICLRCMITMADVSKLKIALVQMAVGADKAANLRKAVQAVREASKNGANIVTLPVSRYSLSVFSLSTARSTTGALYFWS